MRVALLVGCGTALVLLAAAFWIWRVRRFQARHATFEAKPVEMPAPSETLIWIEADGRARELSDADKAYVDSVFSPFDGARPYVKAHYEQRDGWGRLTGYLERGKLPQGMTVHPARIDGPMRFST